MAGRMQNQMFEGCPQASFVGAQRPPPQRWLVKTGLGDHPSSHGQDMKARVPAQCLLAAIILFTASCHDDTTHPIQPKPEPMAASVEDADCPTCYCPSNYNCEDLSPAEVTDIAWMAYISYEARDPFCAAVRDSFLDQLWSGKVKKYTYNQGHQSFYEPNYHFMAFRVDRMYTPANIVHEGVHNYHRHRSSLYESYTYNKERECVNN
jgi:hypothetical protein